MKLIHCVDGYGRKEDAGLKVVRANVVGEMFYG